MALTTWELQRERKEMIRRIHEEDAPGLEHICKTALGHETTSAHLKHRIQELSHDPCYYIAVYEDDVTHEILGFIQAEKYIIPGITLWKKG